MTPREDKSKVPSKVVRFKPGKFNVRQRTYSKPLMYGENGQKLIVTRWVRWPSYDFIFAVPDKTNKYFKTEKGFFQYRDSRKSRRGACFYVDVGELKELVAGFTDLLKRATDAH